MKAYFINLDRTPDRREWFLEQVRRLGIDFHRIPAIDARDLDEADMAHWRSLSSGSNSLSSSEIACFLSHRRCWRQMLDDGEDWAYVSEDDAHLSEDIGQFLGSVGWIPAGADLVQAETNLRRQELSFKLHGQSFGHAIRRLKSFHFGSAGYFVSRNAARKLLDHTDRHCEPADQMLFSPHVGMLRRLDVYQISPALCLQDYLRDSHGFGSLILPERSDFHENDPRSAKARGLRKLRRETLRVLAQIASFWRRLYVTAARKSVFETVAFDDTRRP